MSKFSEHDFEQKLFKLKDSHDSIASLSNWCLSHVEHHSKVVATWLGALKKVKIDHRILLFYLANDIIQYSKKKGLAYVSSFAPALQKATTMVRDPNIRNKILRIFKIWDERNVYDETFLVDLSSLLTRGHKSANRIDLEDFQPNLLYSRLKSCQTLEEDTDAKMKSLIDNPMPLTDTEKLRTTLKNRKASEDVILEIDEGIKKISAFISSLEAEIKERTGLIDLLDISEQYYDKEFGEAKGVSNAYKCFTNRVKTIKKKLDEKIGSLPSPVPTPSPTAPSPEPDPLDSTDERSDFEFTPAPGGTASFMDGSLFSNQTIAAEFENYYTSGASERIDQDAAYSPGSAYNGADSFTDAPTIAPTVTSIVPHHPVQDTHHVPILQPPPVVIPPANVPPVFNYFRPITADTTPPPPPPPPPPVPVVIPGLDQSSASLYNTTFHDSTIMSDCSSEALRIEVITSPTKDHQTSLSTLLESMVAENNVSLQPPPAPPALDFAGWGDNADYWESPESPPLFEKEGLPPPLLDVGLATGNDVDMRSKDVDHRNLISLTGGVEQDWDFPPPSAAGDNEDMEMSDEDVEKIENVGTALNNESGYSSKEFPILSIKPDVNSKGKVCDNTVELASSTPLKTISPNLQMDNMENKPVFQTISSLEADTQAIPPVNHGPDSNYHSASRSGIPSTYQPPPLPPPPQLTTVESQTKVWPNVFPPPPAPPVLPQFNSSPQTISQFENKSPAIPQFESSTPPRPPNFQNPGAPPHLRFDGGPPRGFEPPPPPPPFPPLPTGVGFNQYSRVGQPPPIPQEPMVVANFERSPRSTSAVGQPIPSFEAPGVINQFERPHRPTFFGGFRPRFDPRNFGGGGPPYFRGGMSPNRFQGHPFRPLRQRFPPQRF